MAIVCGTDFSEQAARAVAVAAFLAARSKQPLHIVYALDAAADDLSDPRQTVKSWATGQLRFEADRHRAIAGSIHTHVITGLPDDALLEVASQVSAKLVIVGSAGRRHGRTAMGSHADRIAHRSRTPVLVIRDAARFEQWALESKPLRIVLGADDSLSSEAAMRWINELRGFGPCEVIAVHVYWPPEQFRRLGLGGVRSYVDPDPEVMRTLERELADRLSRLPGSGPIRYRTEPHLGRIADCLADIAAEENADLVVVGSHPRNILERVWQGSVSRGLLHCARGSVACVPTPGVSYQEKIPPEVRVILVATDFSTTGDAAIPLAYAVANQGATIHLIHIVDVSPDPIAPHDIFAAPSAEKALAFETARKELLEKIPKDAERQHKLTRVHVLGSHHAALAICQAAERLGVDLVCLGTHGRSAVAKALLGSIAQEVLAHSKCPVLLSRPVLE
jgi:nucleotide-binding universal stress UspA family protein